VLTVRAAARSERLAVSHASGRNTLENTRHLKTEA
jgi:hypothetical protein